MRASRRGLQYGRPCVQAGQGTHCVERNPEGLLAQGALCRIMKQSQERYEFCPSCGVPLPDGVRMQRCPNCGYAFDEARDQAPVSGYLTRFGYGLCGAAAGSQFGAAVVLTDRTVRLGDPRLILFPVIGGITCLAVTVWVGPKLHDSAKRGFESVLFGLMTAAFVCLVVAVFAVTRLDTLLALAGVVLVTATPAIWSVVYRPGGRAKSRRGGRSGENSEADTR